LVVAYYQVIAGYFLDDRSLSKKCRWSNRAYL